jgi:monoamine oxidase
MSPRAWSLLLLCYALPAAASPPAVWTPTGPPAPIQPAPEGATREIKEVDTIILGAGVAGLTIAKEMQKAGRSYVLLEAADRVGGRTYTDRDGDEQGAGWNHNEKNNRATAEVYRPLGAKMLDSSLDRYLFRSDTTHGRSSAANEKTMEDFRRTRDRVEKAARRSLKNGKDLPAGELSRRGGKWADLIKDELGELDAGVNLDEGISGADVFGFGGGGSKDRMIAGGLGAFYREKYAEGVEVKLNTPATGVNWKNPGRSIVTTATGEIFSGRTVVSTVSTGVLESGKIEVTPAWPDWKQQAFEHLKMGVFNRITLTFTDDDFMRYNGELIEPNSWVMNQVKGKEDMAFVVRPFGKKKIVAFVGGDLAKRLEEMGDQRIARLALKHLKRMFGDVVKDKYVSVKVTRWGKNPYTKGSYAYSAVRDLREPFEEGESRSPKEMKTGKRLEWHEVMAQPVQDAEGRNRIFFAGEAVGMGNRRLNRLYQTTVAGAYVSAKVTARKVLAELRSQDRAAKRR